MKSKKHIDRQKEHASRQREEELTFLLEFGEEEDFIKALKSYGINATDDLLNEFRRLRAEKRGLLP